MKFSDDDLRKAVAASVSYSGVLRLLGVQQAGGSRAHYKRRVLKAGIDSSHFTGRAYRKGFKSPGLPTAEMSGSKREGSPVGRMARRVRINVGVLASQDHRVFRWPETKGGDDAMEWDAEWTGKFWECRADGFGRRSWLGEGVGYGNGLIFVHDRQGVTMLD